MRISIVLDMGEVGRDALANTLAYVADQITENFARYGEDNNGTRGLRNVGDTANMENESGRQIGAWRVTE